VFLGPYLQYFSNAQSLTIKWILENRSAEPGIGPGDMFLSNDPYVGTPHQPDTIVAAPVFAGQQLFCWVANVLHHSDIGGSVVGSFCIDAPDIFTDPSAFPPFKIVEGGRVRTDMEQVFMRQSRLPGVVQMDLRAAISANTVTVRKIEALVSRYGADAVKTVMSRVIDAGEQLFTERLRQIPDGTWSHRVYAEASHTGDTGLYRYQLTVRKRGDELVERRLASFGIERRLERRQCREIPVADEPRLGRPSHAAYPRDVGALALADRDRVGQHL